MVNFPISKKTATAVLEITEELEKEEISEEFFHFTKDAEQNKLLEKIGFDELRHYLKTSTTFQERKEGARELRKMLTTAIEKGRQTIISNSVLSPQGLDGEIKVQAFKDAIRFFDMTSLDEITGSASNEDENLTKINEIREKLRSSKILIPDMSNFEDNGAYAEFIKEALAVCQEVVEELEIKEEREKQERIRINGILKDFISTLKKSDRNTAPSFMEQDEVVILNFLEKCNFKGIGVDELYLVEKPKKIIIAAILEMRLDKEKKEKEKWEGFPEKTSAENRIELTILDGFSENPDALTNILSEITPDELWGLARPFIKKTMLDGALENNPFKDEKSLFQLLSFLYGPVTSEISEILAMATEGGLGILNGPRLQQVQIQMDEYKKERCASFFGKLIEIKGMTPDAASRIVAAEITNPSGTLFFPWNLPTTGSVKINISSKSRR